MDLFNQITPHTTILTPNRRLSANLAKQFHTMQKNENKSVWQTPDILPLPSWIQRLWHTYSLKNITSLPRVLNSNQEQVIWEMILQQSKASDYLLQLSKTAEQAKSAFNILKQWQVDFTDPRLLLTEDSRTFLEWATQFENYCQEKNWMDSSCLTSLLIEKIKNNEISCTNEILLVGFTEISPLLQTLLDTYKNQVTHYEFSSRAESVCLTSLATTELEIRAMAKWAKALLEDTENSQKVKIGCIIPNLESNREQVNRIFHETFDVPNLFNISAGMSLSRHPIIHAALKLLSLSNEQIPFETISHLLLSPFLVKAESEILQRANLEVKLRKLNINMISLTQLMNLLTESHCTTLCNHLQQAISLHLQHNKLLISEWVKLIMQQLSILGWPGERSLNTIEYQVVQRWLELLNEYSVFDTILSPQTYQQALQHLTRLVGKTIFQPQTKDSPIQILGMLEAADIEFDYSWIMGLDDTVWPPQANPNPFIPMPLQKTLKMPHASAERELIYCEKLLQQLQRNTTRVIFSYAQHNEERELQPSPLLSHLSRLTADQLPQASLITPIQLLYQMRSLEIIQDDEAPSCSHNMKITGGASVLKHQAACPFKAFAQVRLLAKPFETMSTGFREADRGNIVHTALECIWKTLKNSENLKSYLDNELKQLIQDCAKEAIDKEAKAKNYSARYLDLECKRLEKLLWNWLEIEKQRPEFSVISHEETQEIMLGNLTLALRIDRIDEIPGVGKLIIDYKTGKNYKIDHWFSDRPDEPQLPLYCLTDVDHTVGIAFAQINPNKYAFKGISQHNIEIEGIRQSETPWNQQIIEWRTTLEQVGNQFLQGKAEVNPKNITICNHCHLQPLCRIYERPTTA